MRTIFQFNHSFFTLATLVAWLLVGFHASGQVSEHRYLVYFADKAGTPHSASNPSTFLSERAISRRQNQGIAVDDFDLPVSPLYLDMVAAAGEVRIVYPVKWFNAVLIETEDEAALQAIAALEWVTAVEASPVISVDDELEYDLEPQVGQRASETYGAALNQIEMINGLGLHEDGFRGEGLMIGVFDGGFEWAASSAVLAPVLTGDQVKAAVNFVDENEDVYVRSSHGTRVLSVMAALAPDTMIGTAPDADYVLCITEDVSIERRIEEVLWVVAAEYADSMGVDIINTSLGYTVFDVEDENYTYEDMDGQTALITRGSDRAASRGILIVTSAGNKGNQPWFYISAPADGDSVLAVGAVNANGQAASFSSRGPSFDGRVKPNVMAQGQGTAFTDLSAGASFGNGTSFSSPVIAGMSASLWQAHPEATAWEVHLAIEASAHLFSTPNDSMGFGIPDFEVARTILTALSTSQDQSRSSNSLRIFPNPYSGGPLITDFKGSGRGPVVVEVYSLTGQRIHRSQQVPRAAQLDIGPMVEGRTPGIYLIAISDGSDQQVARLVVQ